jgi:CHAD domain-containing protein
MPIELKAGKSLRKSIRGMARKLMEGALEELTGATKNTRDEAVHEARKAFKKVRALLRLVRPVIGEKTYRSENADFRDAGRPLTEVRDAKILIETLDDLVEHFKGSIAGRSFAGARKELQANLRDLRKRVLDEQNAFAAVGEAVRQALERIEDWTDAPNKWWAVGRGLEEVHRRAGAASESAATEPTVEQLHEWRKQTKYLRYHLGMLRPIWPERLEELASEADHMGELLGDDHDLAVLRRMLTDDPARFGGEGDVEMLSALIDRRRVELEQEAFALGGRFFQEKAEEFTRRLKGYWKKWRAQATSDPSEPRQLAPT